MAAAQGDAPPADFPTPLPITTTTTTTAVQAPPTTTRDQLPVPDVRGRSYTDAALAVQQAGFSPARFDVVDGGLPPDSVRAQSPPGGSTAPRGAIVTLEVAVRSGDAVTVPTVVGLKTKDATKALHDAGLAVQVTEQQSPDDHQPQGHVWKQSPEAGTKVSPGTTVTIFVTPN
jgi:serine/threonine-protein kinase